MENEYQTNKEIDYFEGILITDNQETTVKLLSNSDFRALELSRKGIFACPLFSKLFADKDESKME